jgi:N utilization substance protein A
MAIIRSEFALALNQVASERGIDAEVVLDSMKQAILAAYRKDFGEDELEEIVVQIDPESGEALLLKKGKDITPPGFGRIAAQTAKQVVLQRVREAEKSAILTDYQQKVGTVTNGMVLRYDGPNVLIDIGRAQGTMPPHEQIPSEEYKKNRRMAFYIKEIKEGRRGNDIIVSRADRSLVSGLFAREVPEVSQGSVEIRAVAREPGSRTKIAVFSDQQGVDPVGSCVGQKGVRVQAVINELGGEEKIDVIQWSEDPIQFITQALSPAKDLKVIIDEKKKRALVLVPDDQLSLAIGRNGQNVRLAAKLTDYKIDIRSAEEYSDREKEEEVKKSKLEEAGLSLRVVKALEKAQIKNIDELKDKSDKELKAIKGLGKKALEEIQKALKK